MKKAFLLAKVQQQLLGSKQFKSNKYNGNLIQWHKFDTRKTGTTSTVPRNLLERGCSKILEEQMGYVCIVGTNLIKHMQQAVPKGFRLKLMQWW
jgi:hypothetical protein